VRPIYHQKQSSFAGISQFLSLAQLALQAGGHRFDPGTLHLTHVG
jgi:hypothetical protein